MKRQWCLYILIYLWGIIISRYFQLKAFESSFLMSLGESFFFFSLFLSLLLSNCCEAFVEHSNQCALTMIRSLSASFQIFFFFSLLPKTKLNRISLLNLTNRFVWQNTIKIHYHKWHFMWFQSNFPHQWIQKL